MLARVRQWLERRARAAAGRPTIRVDDVEVTPRASGRGAKAVVRGMNLYAIVTPPRVTIGGETLVDAEFSRDGRTIRGRLRRLPGDRVVLVDYGTPSPSRRD